MEICYLLAAWSECSVNLIRNTANNLYKTLILKLNVISEICYSVSFI